MMNLCGKRHRGCGVDERFSVVIPLPASIWTNCILSRARPAASQRSSLRGRRDAVGPMIRRILENSCRALCPRIEDGSESAQVARLPSRCEKSVAIAQHGIREAAARSRFGRLPNASGT